MRSPATITEVQNLTRAECSFSPCSDERYGYSEYFSEYAGIRQKWVLYHSAEMHTRQEKTFESNLEKDLAWAKTALRKLGVREFACEPDAQIAAEKWLEEHPGYRFRSLDITTVSRKMEKKRGRPKNDEPVVLSYLVDAESNSIQKPLKGNGRNSGDSCWQRMIRGSLLMNCSQITRGRERLKEDSGS